MNWLAARSLSPLMFGSGRAFTNDAGVGQMKSRALPTPSTIAGAVRSWVAQNQGWHDEDRTEDLLKIHTFGPLLRRNEVWHFPAPANAVASGEPSPLAVPLAPREEPGCFLPDGLWPCVPIEPIVKTKTELATWWSEQDLLDWLINPQPTRIASAPRSGFLPVETRTHVGIDPARRAHVHGRLFSTEGTCFGWQPSGSEVREELMELAFGYSGTGSDSISRVHGLGGDRRLAAMSDVAGPEIYELPTRMESKLIGASRFCTILITPGLFSLGWRPDPPLAGAILRGACVGRPEPLNRWSRTLGKLADGTPKEQYWMVPAGAVYFWETDRPLSLHDLQSLWCRPLVGLTFNQADHQDLAAHQGYGVALLGVWR